MKPILYWHSGYQSYIFEYGTTRESFSSSFPNERLRENIAKAMIRKYSLENSGL